MEEGSAPNQKLRRAREQNMWTIPEAAEKVGVDAQTFWRWENAVQRRARMLCASSVPCLKGQQKNWAWEDLRTTSIKRSLSERRSRMK